jgi:hypothetical protein
MTRRKVRCAGPGCGRTISARSNDPEELQPMNHRDPFDATAVCPGTQLEGLPIGQAVHPPPEPEAETRTGT